MDRRRKLYLENEIDRVQEEALVTLRNVRKLIGFEKIQAMDHFLKLNKDQTELEKQLAQLREDDLAEEDY